MSSNDRRGPPPGGLPRPPGYHPAAPSPEHPQQHPQSGPHPYPQQGQPQQPQQGQPQQGHPQQGHPQQAQPQQAQSPQQAQPQQAQPGQSGPYPQPSGPYPPVNYLQAMPQGYEGPAAAAGAPQIVHDHPSRPIAATGPITGSPVASHPNITRSRAYRFILDAQGLPIELGSGRSGKAFLGEEQWMQSKTAFRRHVAIKMLQKGVSPEDALRFQMEKELLERVQGHPNIIQLFASGEADNESFIPHYVRDTVENDFMIIELCDMSLEERLKGTRGGQREDLLLLPLRDRLFRVLEYMLPIASAIEYAHLECNVCHRDIKPGNILLRLPNPRLQGSNLDVRLADFNVGKVREEEQDLSVTRMQAVPGTLFFQSPEQETNMFELLVNVTQGSEEVTYFEDFYIAIAQNDTFQLFNRGARYYVRGADLRRKRITLDRPYEDRSETNVRAQILKSVDRPADIYSLGALFYYLVSGAIGNPKTLYDAFHKFIEYDGAPDGVEGQNTVEAYVEHEYSVINNLRTPRLDENNQPVVAPVDRFFSYKHYLDGNGELIDKEIMKIIAKSMIRNKPDSYCQAWDISTEGISRLVYDLRRLYGGFGTYMPSRPGHLVLTSHAREGALSRAWGSLKGAFGGSGGGSGGKGRSGGKGNKGNKGGGKR
ncbi:MAG: protein kinase [Nannocystaceae bacterium]